MRLGASRAAEAPSSLCERSGVPPQPGHSVQVDILDRMGYWATRIGGKRIAYFDLVAPNGMPHKVIPS